MEVNNYIILNEIKKIQKIFFKLQNIILLKNIKVKKIKTFSIVNLAIVETFSIVVRHDDNETRVNLK